MHEGFPSERKKSEEMGKETADGLIAHVQELLEDGFYDEAACDEAKTMLRTAQLLTQNPETKKEIAYLLDDIESRYGN